MKCLVTTFKNKLPANSSILAGLIEAQPKDKPKDNLAKNDQPKDEDVRYADLLDKRIISGGAFPALIPILLSALPGIISAVPDVVTGIKKLIKGE